jgi:hypothetical protein
VSIKPGQVQSALCTSIVHQTQVRAPASQLDTLCEQAAKRGLNFRDFLGEPLAPEWQGRRLKVIERGLRLARFPYIKTLSSRYLAHKGKRSRTRQKP